MANYQKTDAWVKVQITPVPHDVSDAEWAAWCDAHGLLVSGRRAWSASITSYLRNETHLMYWDGTLIAFVSLEDDDIIPIHGE